MTEQPTPAGQLRLLEPPPAPPHLRLDARTRRVGLAGVAHARQLLAEQARRRAEREAALAAERRHPPTRPAAA